MYPAGIRVKVLHFVAHANQLAAAFVFPPLPAHAQLAVFNSPLARITAAVVTIPRAVVFELERRRSACKACSRKAFALMKAIAFSVERATPAASLCALAAPVREGSATVASASDDRFFVLIVFAVNNF